MHALRKPFDSLTRLLLIGSVVLLGVWPAAAGPGGRPVTHPAAPPAGAPAGWWEQVQRSIQLEDYGVVASVGATSEYRAANPAQKFDSQFDGHGVSLAGRDMTGWRWGLSLSGWGSRKSLRTPERGRLSAHEDRVELARNGLNEWFVNTPAGLEHGFTVFAPPSTGSGSLMLDLAVTGDLRPVFADDGQAVDFYGKDNVGVLRYAKLMVSDATGKMLPSRMEPMPGGLRIVVEGETAAFPITVDPLATTSAWTAVGEAPGDRFGFSISTAGDVNGDGYSDVIVSAEGHSGFAGKAYLFLGGPTGLAATAAWTSTGEGANFGISVSTAGDVNGDGYADVIIGAYGYNAGRGRAYLYLGGPGGLATTAAWTATGEMVNSGFGDSVATAGDVNDDGYADVIVGASPDNFYTGKAYLYFGGPGGLAITPAWTATGEAMNDSFGQSVAAAGDINGDGYADVIVGAPGYYGNSGNAYLYLGGPAGLVNSSAWTPYDTNNSYYGASVATAGDVNGDGYADVIVGSYGNDGATGSAYLYLGGPGGLAIVPVWTAVGPETSDYFGYPVATAGDINGDGYADVIVGASAFSDNLSAGDAYLFLGGPGGLSTTAAWTAAGEATGDLFGYAVATVGDVNGDGYSDVIVGAYHGNNSTGKAYVYLGGPGGLVTTSAWSRTGEATGDFFGYSVSTAGDVNGDGYADVVVGAYANHSYAGKAYLYMGGPGGLATTPAWTAVGESVSNFFGISVATAGDVNGDGYADVIVGAYGYNNSLSIGKTYLYLGGPGGLATTAAWTATGEETNSCFGVEVAAAGDVNGDGYSDIVVSAPCYENYLGKVYLYLGGPGGPTITPVWNLTGELPGNYYFEISLATAGDVNGDGYADVIVGAAGYNNGSTAGKAYLYLGGPHGLAPIPAWTAAGEGGDDYFGASVATAGDVNGDGYSDVIVGSYGNSSGLGKAYLYLGGPRGLAPTPAWTAVGESDFELFGLPVGTAGDVNGDGYADVIIGASGYQGYTGRAYAFLGGPTGLGATPAWTATGEAPASYWDWTVATAGDVNGDGYSDVIVGSRGYNAHTGKAYLYFGGGGSGAALRPRQIRADLSAPIGLGGRAYQQEFRLGLTLQSPIGAAGRRLQWQVRSWGGAFTPALSPVQSDDVWYHTPTNVARLVALATDAQRYIWRARVQYDPAESPFVGWSRWVTMSGNSLYEADLVSSSRAGPPACIAPVAEIFIRLVTLDPNGKPVLHYQDPNPPSAVTGYDVYRASAPAGPWTLLGSNVVDMDPGTPDIQYVDQTGDLGSLWFYKVAARNNACGAEGPW